MLISTKFLKNEVWFFSKKYRFRVNFMNNRNLKWLKKKSILFSNMFEEKTFWLKNGMIRKEHSYSLEYKNIKC